MTPTVQLLLAGIARRLLPSPRRAFASSTSPPTADSTAPDIWELNEDDASSVSGVGSVHGRGRRRSGSVANSASPSSQAGGFRVLVVPGLTKEAERPPLRRSRHPLAPRVARMRPVQAWPSVWPTARTFHPAAVPLPVRQGKPSNATENAGISPTKWGNTELIKVPNFLHLTPAHVAAHCAAIRHLCTPWPDALKDPAVVSRHLPLRVVTTDYLRATSSLRDPRARRVELSLSLDVLKKLDDRSREKLACLVGFSSYASLSPDGLRLSMWSERCPWRFQNYDYLMYALSALYSQSLRLDPWEAGKEWRDNRQYQFAGSSSEQKLHQLPAKPPTPVVQAYGAALCRLHRPDEGGETHGSLREYGRAVERLLGLAGGHDGPTKKSPPSHKSGGEANSRRQAQAPSAAAPSGQ